MLKQKSPEAPVSVHVSVKTEVPRGDPACAAEAVPILTQCLVWLPVEPGTTVCSDCL